MTDALLQAFLSMTPETRAKLIKNVSEFNRLKEFCVGKKFIEINKRNDDLLIRKETDEVLRLKAINKETPFSGVKFIYPQN